jgi:sugar phosphate isomerase/epimerase
MFDLGISTTITNDKDVFSGIAIIANSSFRFIEIRCEKGHFNYEDEKEIKRLKTLLKKNSLTVTSLHPPIWIDIANIDDWTRTRSIRETEKVILVANRLNVPKIIMHPGKNKKNGNLKKASESLSELISFAKEWKTDIILENTFPDDFGSRIDELKTLSDKFNLPVCIDTSHASAKENLLNKFIPTFNDKIKHVHISDSLMKGSDDHLIPYTGKIIWEPVVEFINTHEGIGIFEIAPRESSNVIENLEKVKNKWKK